MWWQSSRLDRIEQNMERMQENMNQMQENMGQMQQSIRELAEISNATNRRIDRFVEEMREGNKEQRARTEQLQRAMEYLLSRDG
jgi:DNA anti-recombination protein RmuC